VLTKPSKGVKNDGYDNEDSDYILYVNDILGSEEAGHKYVARMTLVTLSLELIRYAQEPLPHSGRPRPGNFWTSGEMSKFEDSGSCRCQGHQEQDSLFQPEYDGSLRTRLGRSFPLSHSGYSGLMKLSLL